MCPYVEWVGAMQAQMTIQEAMSILGLSEPFTIDDLKSAFRRAAKRYHPDTGSPEASAEKFILANTAYELLLAYLTGGASDQPQDVVDPILEERLQMMLRAYEHAMQRLAQRFRHTAEDIVRDVVRKLQSYGSKDRLKSEFERDVREILRRHLQQFHGTMCSMLHHLIAEHDEWLNGMFNAIFRHYRRQAIRQAWLSPFFWILGTALAGASAFGLWQLGLVALLPCALVMFPMPSLVGTLYSVSKWRENRFRLQIDVDGLVPPVGMFAPQTGNAWSVDETAGVGGLGGAVFGGIVGGVAGAIIGGIIGGLLGALFGEPYEVTAKKVLDAFLPQLDEYLRQVASRLDSELQRAWQVIVQRVIENYTASKQETYRMLPAEVSRARG